MAQQSKDKWTGRGKQLKGKAKEKLGQLSGNEEVEAEGLGEQVEGKVQETWGKAKEEIEDLKDEIRRGG